MKKIGWFLYYTFLAIFFFIYGVCGTLAGSRLREMNDKGFDCISADLDRLGDPTYKFDSASVCQEWKQMRRTSVWYEHWYDKAFGSHDTENRVKEQIEEDKKGN